MNPYFSLDDKISDIINQNPSAKDFLIANGFNALANRALFDKFANNVTLRTALQMRKLNGDLFESQLVAFLQQKDSSADLDLIQVKGTNLNHDIFVGGVLPCPIRVPLLESFEQWLASANESLGYTIGYDLRSANLGLNWIIDKIKQGDVDKLPDMLMSAGFDLFFDKKLMAQYLDNDIFEAVNSDINADFSNDTIELKDPQNKYLITGVIPAVFLVNKRELGDRPMPKTWDDLLSPIFEDSVAVPLGDLDLFNALVVNIHKSYGMEGIVRLGKNYKKSLHPAEMVKQRSHSNASNPAISIIPYFFTQMPRPSHMVTVWPEDGAMISPIFLIAKKAKQAQLKPLIDFFTSEHIGTIFSANGKFPSTNIGVNNHLSAEQKFKWVGWDYIHANDIGALLKEIEIVFNETILK